MKILTSLVFAVIFLSGFMGFSGDPCFIPVDVCPDKTELVTVKGDNGNNIDIENFPYTYAYGNYNKTFNSYRAIFINFDREKDRDFRKVEGDEIKVVIMIFNMKGEELTEGEYTMSGGDTGKQFAVAIETSEGTLSPVSLNGQDIGGVTIYRVDEDMLCGEVNVKGSMGVEVTGTFSVANEKTK